MRGSEFVFDYVHLLYYKCHRINFNHVGSYIVFLDSTKVNIVWKKNSNIFYTTHFNHNMTFFKLTN